MAVSEKKNAIRYSSQFSEVKEQWLILPNAFQLQIQNYSATLGEAAGSGAGSGRMSLQCNFNSSHSSELTHTCRRGSPVLSESGYGEDSVLTTGGRGPNHRAGNQERV